VGVIFRIMISGDQIRDGRSLLRWSARELGQKAGVGMATVQRLESGKRDIGTFKFGILQKIKDALEAGGIEFLDDGSVKRRKTE
jgi:transcriptional regulator with XRE-family HTH domain